MQTDTAPVPAPEATPELANARPVPRDWISEALEQRVGSQQPPPALKLPKQLAKLITLRALGYDTKEIADRLGVQPRTIYMMEYKARKKYGWSDLGDRLAHQALPRAVDNIIKHLEHEGTPDAVKEGQSLMTRTFAAGVGVLQTHSAIKQTSDNKSLTIMRIEISMPELPEGQAGPVAGVLAAPRRAVPQGATAALPASVEGEVVE